jgi:urease accessory protein
MILMTNKNRLITLLALLTSPTLALAHTLHGHAEHGFDAILAGLLHPFSGLDHLVALLVVSIWFCRMAHLRAAALLLAGVGLFALGHSAQQGLDDFGLIFSLGFAISTVSVLHAIRKTVQYYQLHQVTLTAIGSGLTALLGGLLLT